MGVKISLPAAVDVSVKSIRPVVFDGKPNAIVNVVLLYGQREPEFIGMVVVAGHIVVAPLLKTQLGSGLHIPSALHVRLRLPPTFMKPLAHMNVANEPLNTTVVSSGVCTNCV